MVQIIAMSYRTFKEKIRLINTEFKGKKFMDLGGVLYHFGNDGVYEEENVYNLCRNERLKVN